MAQKTAEFKGVPGTSLSTYGGEMNHYRDESDVVRVTGTVTMGYSNIPLDIVALKRRLAKKIDAEIDKWAREYFGIPDKGPR